MNRNLRISLVAGIVGFPVVLLFLQGPRDSSPPGNSPDRSSSRQSDNFLEKAPVPPAAKPAPARPKRATTHTATVSPGLFVGDAFEGTFVQLTKEHRTWPASRWREEFDNLRRIGIRIVIVQWSQYDDADFTVTEGPASVIEAIAAAADGEDMDLYVGLSLRKSWGQAESFTATYMAEELERNTQIADKLYKLLTPHPSFSGWYIPQEVTDLDLATDHQAMTRNFFRALSLHLQKVDGLKPVLASGYTDPDKTRFVHLVCWWTQFLNESEIDILLFQDGAGVARRVKWQNNLPFIEAMALLAAEFQQNEVWLVADTFTQTHGQPMDNQPFAAKSADVTRVREQVAALSKFKKRLIAYSYFDYMRPSAGEEAALLYNGYRRFVEDVSARNTSRALQGPADGLHRPGY